MERLMTACLLLSSLLFFTSSCHTSKKLNLLDTSMPCRPVFDQRISTGTYNTQIDFYNHHLSGLLVFKALNDTTKRAVFISETGFKFFDLEFTTNTFKVQYCVDALNKKPVIEVFKKDLGYLLNTRSDKPVQVSKTDSTNVFKFAQPKGGYDFYTTDVSCKKLEQIERGREGHKNLTITILRTGSEDFSAISIVHRPVKLKIAMKQIDK